MNASWLTPVATAAPVTAAIAAAIPVLETPRLLLRAPRATDWTTLEPIWTTDRAKFIGGPFSDEDAWLDFSQAVAGWVLRGVSGWTVTLKTTGEVLGLVGIYADFGDPERELGWLMTEAAEGRGYATEAAVAARDHAHGTLGLRGLVSYIDATNSASLALADRLGARHDPNTATSDEDCLCYRHPDPEVRP